MSLKRGPGVLFIQYSVSQQKQRIYNGKKQWKNDITFNAKFITYTILNYISKGQIDNKSQMSALADCCFPCCKCVAFFGILFYFIMAFLILGQVQFLKFIPVNQTSSVVACIITCIIQAVILVVLVLWERHRNKSTVQRQNYISFESERRPRESTFKGIALGEIKNMKEAQIQ